jgi:DNA-binding transcriptional LysR family regulator
LKRLEGTVGQKLIERSASHFRVTSAGDSLYRECIEIYGSILRLGQQLRNVSDEVDEHVNLVMASHVQSPLLDAALSAFHEAHPLATITIDVMPSLEALDRVGHRSASFAICLVDQMSQRFEYRRLYREHFALYCGPSHPLFGVDNLNIGDLAGHSSVTFTSDQVSNLLRSVSTMRAAAGLEQRVVGSSSNLEEVRRMIMAGLGIGPLPVHVVTRDVKDGLLWQLPPYEGLPPVDVHVIHNRRTNLNRAESSLLGRLLDAIDATPVADRTYGFA